MSALDDGPPLKPDQVLRTTARSLRVAVPRANPAQPAVSPAAAVAGQPALPKDLSWLLIVLVAASVLGWLGLLQTYGMWSFTLATVACVLVTATPVFSPGKERGPTVLLALGAAALLPVLAIAADLAGISKPPSSYVIGFTGTAVLGALLAALAVPLRRATAPISVKVDEAPAGRYRLVRRLGMGGMGEVWRAEHDTLARPAALKLIKRQKREDASLEKEILERFRKEAEVTARLTSPHTVVLYDFGVTEQGILY